MVLLKIENLSKNILPGTGESLVMLQNINLEVGHHETTALLQLSGTGSSILLQTIAGKLSPTSGKISLNGNEITGKSPDDSQISYILPGFLPAEAAENTIANYLKPKMKKTASFFPAFGKKLKPEQQNTLDKLHTDALFNTKKTVKELSPADALLLSFLPALYNNPKLLTFDPLISILPGEVLTPALYRLYQLCMANDITLLFNTHSPQLAFHLAQRILIFNGQNLVREIDNTRKTPETLEELFRLYGTISYVPLHHPSVGTLVTEQYI